MQCRKPGIFAQRSRMLWKWKCVVVNSADYIQVLCMRDSQPKISVLSTYQIVLARSQDIDRIPDIELAAVTLLQDYAPASVQVENSSERDLREAQTDGRLWVALSGDDPVGFAHVIILKSGLAHLEELDVHPDHGRRGLGTRLVKEVFQWVRGRGYPALTLTTFREPPFNMPFYQSLGFEELPRDSLTADLLNIIDHETGRGLDPEKRVVMIWRLL
jgi:GNAT superfamily N-acetyltransferase